MFGLRIYVAVVVMLLLVGLYVKISNRTIDTPTVVGGLILAIWGALVVLGSLA